jgi:hypothetical protein
MPQPGQGHCKKFQTLELSLNTSKKTYLKPVTACKPIELETVQKIMKKCDKELVTVKGQMNRVQHENHMLSNKLKMVE